MTCKEASRLLSAGLDQELPITQRAALRLHLSVCVACDRVHQQFDFLRKAVSRYPGPDDER